MSSTTHMGGTMAKLEKNLTVEDVHECEGPDRVTPCPQLFAVVTNVVLDMGPIEPRVRYMCHSCWMEWRREELTANHLTHI